MHTDKTVKWELGSAWEGDAKRTDQRNSTPLPRVTVVDDEFIEARLAHQNLLTILLRVFSPAATAGVGAMGSIEASLEEEEDVFPFT